MLTSSVLIPVGAIYPPIKTNWHSQQKPRTKNKKESLTEIIYQPRSNEDQNYDHGGGKKKPTLNKQWSSFCWTSTKAERTLLRQEAKSKFWEAIALSSLLTPSIGDLCLAVTVKWGFGLVLGQGKMGLYCFLGRLKGEMGFTGKRESSGDRNLRVRERSMAMNSEH